MIVIVNCEVKSSPPQIRFRMIGPELLDPQTIDIAGCVAEPVGSPTVELENWRLVGVGRQAIPGVPADRAVYDVVLDRPQPKPSGRPKGYVPSAGGWVKLRLRFADPAAVATFVEGEASAIVDAAQHRRWLSPTAPGA